MRPRALPLAWLDRALGGVADPELALNLAQALEMVGALQARCCARAPVERP